jgi:hypothetical protein
VKNRYSLTEQDDGSWLIEQESGSGSTWPAITKPTKRAAIARLMQLVDIGPVAPQLEPESVCIGSIYTAQVSDEPRST